MNRRLLKQGGLAFLAQLPMECGIATPTSAWTETKKKNWH